MSIIIIRDESMLKQDDKKKSSLGSLNGEYDNIEGAEEAIDKDDEMKEEVERGERKGIVGVAVAEKGTLKTEME